MSRMLSICLAGAASVALLGATPALAAGDAAAGLMTLKEFSVFSAGNAKISQEVGGKTWIGGNLTGNGGQFGFGTNNTQGFTNPAAGAAPTLTVGGDVTVSNLHIQNGAAPGGPGGKVGPMGLTVGGKLNAQNADLNATGAVTVGNLAGNISMSGGTLTYGTKTGNINGTATVSHNATLNPGLQTGLAAQTTTYANNLKALSSSLFGMTADSSINATDHNDVKFVATPGADGVAVFDITNAAAFFSTASAFDFSGDTAASTIIINVTNATAISLLNIHQNYVGAGADTFSQKVIWNFSSQIQNIDFGQLDGSILAMNSNVSSSSGFIQGSVAAQSLLTTGGNGLNTEVHLGTFNGNIPFAVPEPATWAMMLMGFFGLGGLVRRQRRLAAA